MSYDNSENKYKYTADAMRAKRVAINSFVADKTQTSFLATISFASVSIRLLRANRGDSSLIEAARRSVSSANELLDRWF